MWQTATSLGVNFTLLLSDDNCLIVGTVFYIVTIITAIYNKAGLSTSYQDGANAIQRHSTNFFETR